MTTNKSSLTPGEVRVQALGKRYWLRSRDPSQIGESETDTDPYEDEDAGDAYSLFRRPTGEIWALRDISFSLQPGERVALVGANGAGKSTLVRILARTLPPSEGVVEGAGIVIPFGALRKPLNSQSSGTENLRALAWLLRIPSEQLDEHLPKIVEFSGLGPRANEKVSRLSDGSFARLSMAMGLFIDAHIYLVDDNIKVGDENYRARFMEKFAERVLRGITLVYASNSLAQLRSYCQRAVWLRQGRLVADGEIGSIVQGFLMEDNSLVATKTASFEEPSTPTVPPALLALSSVEQLNPMKEWLDAIDRAETAWRKVLDQSRQTAPLKELPSGGSDDKAATCEFATVQRLLCLNSAARPIERTLPGEALILELRIVTLVDDVEVNARLELHHRKMLVLVSEPLLPFVARVAGEYVFRVELPGDLFAHVNRDVCYEFIARALFRTNDKGSVILAARCGLHVQGNIRPSADEKRVSQGYSATSIVRSTPFQLAPELGNGVGSVSAYGDLSEVTEVDEFHREPALRPRLKWMVYCMQNSQVEVTRNLAGRTGTYPRSVTGNGRRSHSP